MSVSTQIMGTTLTDIWTSGMGVDTLPQEQFIPGTQHDSDAKSDASFDPLFDGEEDAHEDFHSTFQSSTDPRANVSITSNVRQSQPSARSLAPPKNAPPLLDASTYSTFSADVFMTASIDGQVILWDKRSYGSPRKGGVGRLWMSEKTPPWCLSVSPLICFFKASAKIQIRHVGQQMGAISSLAVEMAQSMFGICASWV
jgi:hypothetical protein